MKDIKSLTLSQLKEEMAALGEKPFRAKQLYEWMKVKLARDYGEMTNIQVQGELYIHLSERSNRTDLSH